MGAKWQIFSAAGSGAIWTPKGREILFLGADNAVVSVEVKKAAVEFEAGFPRPLFSKPSDVGLADVARDGIRFLGFRNIKSPPPAIHVILNWPASLKK
jgi:hypothetical protein